MTDQIRENVSRIQKELEDASQHWGKPPEIIAVSKTVPADTVNEVAKAGIFHLGENHAQEIISKYTALDARFQIDFIGQLQNNKVKSIIDKVAMIQSLDRMSTAQEIDKRAQQHELVMPVLVEVNIGGETQKGGVHPDETIQVVRDYSKLPGIRVCGLMSVMPNLEQKEELIPLFRKMRTLFERLREEAIANTDIYELSMGMSGDYIYAAQEGATHVRIGSAIFGSRKYAV